MASNTTIALKKSATPSAVPTAANLVYGEIAINYADGKLYYKNVNNQVVEISPSITIPNSYGTVDANGTLLVSDTTSDILTLSPGNNITIVGDAVNDKATIGLSNDVTIPGLLTLSASSGDEGGEIKLANAITNSVLSGKVVVDIYQNKLRFFEEAGTNRGAFINLASASAGVGSDLLAGASGTDSTAREWASGAFNKANIANQTADLAFNKANGAAQLSFITISNDDQNVVADSNNDTLTIVGSNGILVLGNSYFDKINIGLTETGVNQGSYGSLGFLNGTELAQVTYDVDKYGRLTGGTHSQVDLRTGLDPVYKKNAFSLILTDSQSANADTQEDTLTVTGANGISVLGNTYFSYINVALNKTDVIAATYGGATVVPVYTVDAWGRLTSASNVSIVYPGADFGYGKLTVDLGTQVNADAANDTVGFRGANGITIIGDNTNQYVNVALNKTAVTAATYGGTDSTLSFNVATFTVDAHGRLTAASNVTTNLESSLDNRYVQLIKQSQTITGDVTITGNLVISGNTLSYSANNFVVNDPLIILANNNISDAIDIGFVGHYQNTTGANVHTGLYREHQDKMYYLFNDYDKEPGGINHIGPLSNNMTLAVLNADIRTSNLTLGGANAITTINGKLSNTSGALFSGDLIVSGNLAFDTPFSTRIWDPGANTMAFITTQSERARISNTGNVLIARTVESTIGNNVRLDVAGGVNASAVFANGVPLLSNTSGTLYNGTLIMSGNIAFDTPISTRITLSAANVMSFFTAQTQRMKLEANDMLTMISSINMLD